MVLQLIVGEFQTVCGKEWEQVYTQLWEYKPIAP